jgi:hypothetical protein
VERLVTHCVGQAERPEIELVVLYIQGTALSSYALRRAAQRIRSNVRRSDSVWWLDMSCAIVLSGATLECGQVVAKRLMPLLADVECAMQILSGGTAQAFLQRLSASHAILLEDNQQEIQCMPENQVPLIQPVPDTDTLPYLAFLANYPSYRLLHLFPYELARRHHCVPVGVERKILTIATCRRLEYHIVSQFQEATQCDIFQVRCEAGMIDDVLNYWQRTLLA